MAEKSSTWWTEKWTDNFLIYAQCFIFIVVIILILFKLNYEISLSKEATYSSTAFF